jgi:GNAT superfamily N-acetyltransferase
MTIRGVTKADAAPIAALIRELAREATPADIATRLDTVLAGEGHRVWVYEQAGRIDGVLHAFIRPALEKPVEVVVQSLVVSPAQRKVGIGQALMAQAERWARDSGYAYVALHTRHAAPFYERLGYTVVATPHLMRKRLS